MRYIVQRSSFDSRQRIKRRLLDNRRRFSMLNVGLRRPTIDADELSRYYQR